MENKVVLVLVDGMRPDGACACGHPFANDTMDSTRLLESLSRSKEWTPARYKGTPHTHLISFVKTDVLFHGLRWAFLSAIHPWGKQTITHIHTHAHARTHAHTHTRWNII